MDYPQNLSQSDLHWYDLIQQCRTSGKSDRQWLVEVQEVVPLIITDELPLCEKHSAVPETAQPDTISIRLTIHGVTVEITNQATQSIIQNTVSALRYLC